MTNRGPEPLRHSPGAPSALEKDNCDTEKGIDSTDIEAPPRTPGTIPHAEDWYPNVDSDPGNPQNWPLRRKLFQTAVPTSIAFLCPFGSSVYTPGVSQVMEEFGISREIALLPFVFYLLGLSFGPILAAPLSETFGRKPVYIIALPLFAAFTIGAGFSPNITSLTILRFLAGAASSPGLSLGSGSIADVWAPHKRAIPMACFVTSVQMGPACGPVIGGFVTEKRNWRWTQWVILFGLVIVLCITLCTSETYKLTILKARAKRLKLEGPPQTQRTTIELVKFFARQTLIRPIHMLLTEPIITLFDAYTAFTFGLLNAFFAAFSWVFQTTYGFDLGSTGLTYLGQAVGSMIALAIIIYFNIAKWEPETNELRKHDPKGKLPPESKLIVAKIGAFLLPVSLFWFGWTARPSIHWIVPVVAESFFSCSNLLIFVTALWFFQDCYGAQYGASASSSNTFGRYLTAFAFPLFAVQMFEAMGNGWASSLLGFVSVLLMPIPFAFDRYGPRIRAMSKYIPDE